MKNINPLHLVLGGAGLALIALFLPWVSASLGDKAAAQAAALGVSTGGSANAWAGGRAAPYLILLLVLAAAAPTVINKFGPPPAKAMLKQPGKEKLFSLIAMICAGLALLIVLLNFFDVLSTNSNEFVKVSVGIGLYLDVLATAALGFGCFQSWQSVPNVPGGGPPPPTPPGPPSAPPPMPPQG